MTWPITLRPPTSWSNSHVSTNSREEHFVREQRSRVAVETASGVLVPRPVRLLMLRKRSSKTGWTKKKKEPKREPRGQRDQGHGVKRLLTPAALTGQAPHRPQPPRSAFQLLRWGCRLPMIPFPTSPVWMQRLGMKMKQINLHLLTYLDTSI